MKNKNTKLFPIERVRIGMFVKLDLSWFEHSFKTNSFKITSQSQIDELHALHLKQVRVILDQSDPASLQQPNAAPEPPVPFDPPDKEAVYVFNSIVEAKKQRLEKLKLQRAEIASAENKFVKASAVIKNIDRLIFSNPKETLLEAGKLISDIADVFASENDALMHLIRYQQGGNEDLYFHTLNVSVLAMMLAHELKATESQIQTIGMASLFHDLGKVNVPNQILKKTTRLTKPEQSIYEQHVYHGIQIGQQAGLDKAVLTVIGNHHEYMDGSGFPNKLQGQQIPLITRIVTIANVYDNLCNHIDPGQSVTPHEALALMYSHRRAQFDPAIMAIMVKCLGIYPPGTLVKLSDGATGLVINVNIGHSLRPRILLYDADIPPEEAMILDLSTENEDLSITGSIRPGVLPKNMFDYLSPRKRLNYFVDSKSSNKKTTSTS